MDADRNPDNAIYAERGDLFDMAPEPAEFARRLTPHVLARGIGRTGCRRPGDRHLVS
ncbi:hypothetical protein [Amycolatopsis sp. 195334CR]|uniref:hypothetical protein n=1 Tax=Amycolatopsis sp. 195334CR TaxID=2814588 RepID=UPI001A8EAEFD|nr:hypothetical protein [Amycolatopsis sp. 195334CR]MBN6038428.1 hypothetical protein [Amycolatopsis sp. 195334CR]